MVPGCSRRDVAALFATVCALGLLAGPPARAVTPNDTGFASQWGAENTGQPIPLQIIPSETLGGPVSGTPFADDSASDAWAVTTGSRSIVIGEVDTGVNFEHPDLAANIWSNPGGIGKCQLGQSGCSLGTCDEATHGYDASNESCFPMDEDSTYHGHGTHVAGIMGAVGGNGIGVAGMNWHTSILPVRWVETAAKEGDTKNLVKALDWLIAAASESRPVNVRVVNDSATFTGTKENPELREAIEKLGALGILFVTAAGNDAANENEHEHRSWPCAFELPNEICVSASNNRDELPMWANYGSQVVQLAAPGLSILSTAGAGAEAPSYGFLSGTSMAAAQVSGAAALILSVRPGLSPEELKADILSHVDVLPSLQGKLITGGRLDVCKALPGCVDLVPPPPAPPPPAPPPTPVPPPVIGALKISPTAFRAAKSGPILAPRLHRVGARVRYTDSQPALTEFTVQAARAGVQNAAKQCVAPPRHPHGKQPRRCTRWPAIGRFKRADSSGPNSFLFSAHIGRWGLAPGRYRLVAAPTLGGRRGAEAWVSFRIVH